VASRSCAFLPFRIKNLPSRPGDFFQQCYGDFGLRKRRLGSVIPLREAEGPVKAPVLLAAAAVVEKEPGSRFKLQADVRSVGYNTLSIGGVAPQQRNRTAKARHRATGRWLAWFQAV